MSPVTASTSPSAAQLLTSGHTSLMHGWVPAAIQVAAGVVLVAGVGWRSRRWRTMWLPADFFPNAGNKAQTIARLFGGNAAAWAAFDPTTMITRHGHYGDVAGWFVISSNAPPPRSDRAMGDSVDVG